MNLLLTREERERFAAWLEHEAETAKGLVEQMEKIHAPAALMNREKQEIAAALIIAKKLRSIEDASL